MYITVASSASVSYAGKNYRDDGSYEIKYRYSFLHRSPHARFNRAGALSLVATLHGEASPEVAALLRCCRGRCFVRVIGLVVRILSVGRLSGWRSAMSRISIAVRCVLLET